VFVSADFCVSYLETVKGQLLVFDPLIVKEGSE